jgi:ketosteroid isomerase-like protein
MTNQLEPAVQRLIDATNAGDITAFLAGFTEDGVVDDWGREFKGAAAIRGWSDAEFIGKRVSLVVHAVNLHNGETMVNAEVGGDGFTGPSHFAFQIDGDLVSRMTISE